MGDEMRRHSGDQTRADPLPLYFSQQIKRRQFPVEPKRQKFLRGLAPAGAKAGRRAGLVQRQKNGMGGVLVCGGHLRPPARFPVLRIEIGEDLVGHPAGITLAPGGDVEARQFGNISGVGATYLWLGHKAGKFGVAGGAAVLPPPPAVIWAPPAKSRAMIDLVIKFSPLAPADEPLIEKLDERAFGPGRYARTAYRLREGVRADASLSFVARVGTLLVGANRMTPILVDLTPALLLGPLTVEPAFRSQGVGETLMKHSLDAARDAGHALVLLVGDEDYYSRVGFQRVPHGKIVMPGPVDPDRLLYHELKPGAFAATSGKMRRV
jgi:predicted N-acetyltransferase YhbS